MALWRKMIERAGSMPPAIRAAAISRMLAESCAGSTSTVSAWRSARKKRHSASSCMRTQRRTAPRRLPRWRSPVGWMPETTRIGRLSAGIGILPAAPEQAPQLLAIGAAKDPHEGEIYGHPTSDDGQHTRHAVTDGAFEPAGEHHA